MFEGVIELGDFIIVLKHFVILVPAILLYTMVMMDKLKGENAMLKFTIGMVIVILLTSGVILLLEFQDAKIKKQKLEKIEKLENNPSLVKGGTE